MLSNAMLERFDGRRLRLLLSAFFVLLAVPTAALVWQAWSQLKWEAWYQHRNMAEELTRSIDASLRERIAEAERRSFADYSFLVLAGDPSANFLQRSPLAAYPVETALPGVIGHFQVDSRGNFSTPLLPPQGTEPASVGIDAEEYARRLELAGRLRDILSDNRLVRPGSGERPGGVDSDDAGALEEGVAREPAADRSYSQRQFDELGKDQAVAETSTGVELADSSPARRPSVPRAQFQAAERIANLKVEPAWSERASELEAGAQRQAQAPQPQLRTKRIEQTSVPEGVPSGEAESFASQADATRLRVSTFESEIDPFELGLLDSGHFVLFRNVWRDRQRYVQGMLLDPSPFLASAISDRFESAALAATSDLAVSYLDKIILASTGAGSDYSSGFDELEGTLLYRSRLSAPLDSLGLIFSITQLPPGPGARVLVWVTVLLAATLLGGFFGLHRLAMGQLRLARQQQDFVSAVSHELKTPLTSIRMYGEMLREGWASPDKRQQYYEYIHDESERLTRLIANVLQLASITRNEPQLAMRSITVGELLDAVDAKIAAQARRAGFEIAYTRDARAEDVRVRIDEDCFLQIVINLVDNAIKFSAGATTKRIEIGSRLETGGKIVFSVRDYGPGIPKDQMKKIFQLFYRSGSELTRETVGTGIGLAIVHQLCLAMNGNADVVNMDPGAEFRIAFPAEQL
jgi:signal transduction histidine kinase